MSRLFCILLAAGVVPVLIGALVGAGFHAFLFYNMVIFTLLLVDFLVTPGKKLVEVTRECEDKFSMGIENTVHIVFRNNSGRRLYAEFRDEIPVYMNTKNGLVPTVAISADPHSEAAGKYNVMPLKRGEYHFGKIHARFRGILGLCVKNSVFEAGRSCKVYPNLKDLRRYGLSAIHKNEILTGTKKSKAFTLGTEFESLREYSEGDDYRKINWMATARSDKLIVNSYRPEMNQQVYVMLDSSRVMNSEINYVKKLDYAINSAFLLADVAIGKGDNTGLLVFDSEVRRFVPPGKGQGQFQLIADNLYNVEERFVSADYRNALFHLVQKQKRRSLLCIFTELFNPDEALELAKALKSVAQRHVPLIITIKDERIYRTAYSKPTDVNGVFMKSAALKLIEERRKIAGIFADSGIACLDIPPDRLSIEVVNQYIMMKNSLKL
jgi:uncharacterized protein (DUF58 family)